MTSAVLLCMQELVAAGVAPIAHHADSTPHQGTARQAMPNNYHTYAGNGYGYGDHSINLAQGGLVHDAWPRARKATSPSASAARSAGAGSAATDRMHISPAASAGSNRTRTPSLAADAPLAGTHQASAALDGSGLRNAAAASPEHMQQPPGSAVTADAGPGGSESAGTAEYWESLPAAVQLWHKLPSAELYKCLCLGLVAVEKPWTHKTRASPQQISIRLVRASRQPVAACRAQLPRQGNGPISVDGLCEVLGFMLKPDEPVISAAQLKDWHTARNRLAVSQGEVCLLRSLVEMLMMLQDPDHSEPEYHIESCTKMQEALDDLLEQARDTNV